MTTPTAKKTVRLGSLLDGNKKPKKQALSAEGKEEFNDTMESIEDSSMLEFEDKAFHDDSSPLKSELLSTPNAKSIKDVLIGTKRREVAQAVLEETIPDDTAIITIHDENTNGSNVGETASISPKLALKDILSGKSSTLQQRQGKRRIEEEITEREIIDVEQLVSAVESVENKNKMLHTRIMNSMTNAKKTPLKSLFYNFKKLDKSPAQTEVEEQQGNPHKIPWSRCHGISKLNEISAPYPIKQHITPEEDIGYRRLSLDKKQPMDLSFTFDNCGYSSLNGISTAKLSKITEIQNVKLPKTIWTNVFKPQTVEDVLLNSELKNSVEEWIANAFEKLRKTTTRNKLLRKRPTEVDEFDGFIVDDTYREPENVEDFIPLMILHGEVGKNTLLEAIMESHQGQIFEINTSSNRSKKDILENVMEFSTTHFVKSTGSKGLILFDDVDVLFKEHDKLFWNAIDKVLSISRRPVVLTCRDLNYIPINLIQVAKEENALYHVQKMNCDEFLSYLNKCTRSQGICIPDEILRNVASRNKNDLRKTLMDLQWLSTPPGVCKVLTQKQSTAISCLEKQTICSDLLSTADILHTITKWRSNIKQDVDPTLFSPAMLRDTSGLTDEQKLMLDYVIDYKEHLPDDLKNPLMPYETDISKYLYDQISRKEDDSARASRTFFFRSTHETVKFLNSRVLNRLPTTTDQYASTRMTRNSRKIKEVIDRFKPDEVCETVDDEELFVSFVTRHSKRHVSQEINPIIYEIAKHDELVKSHNSRVYEKATQGTEKGRRKEIVNELLSNHAFRPIWFNGNPKNITHIWR